MNFSKSISYFFHPINFSIIGAFIYFLFIPRYINKLLEYRILAVVLIGTYVFPVILIYLMKNFKMINSYHMTTVEERKFPTLLFAALTLIIGNWLYRTTIVDLLSLFYFGYGIALMFSYLLLQFGKKISFHMTAIGGLIGFLIYFSHVYQINLLLLIIAFFVLSGIIATARLRLNAHTQSEVYLGFFTGVLSQFIAFFIYYNI